MNRSRLIDKVSIYIKTICKAIMIHYYKISWIIYTWELQSEGGKYKVNKGEVECAVILMTNELI